VFTVDTVTASSTRHVTKEQIAEAAAQSRGKSLLKVSTADIKSALSALPYVRSVHVYRRFPNGLDILIEEYEPAAGVQAANGKSWLVADDGRVLEKATQQTISSLPLIVGAEGLQLQPGGSIPPALLAAMPVVEMLGSADVSAGLPELEHISVSTGGDVVVHLQGGTELRLGEPVDLKQKMMDAAEIIQKNLRDGKTLEYVDASAGRPLAVKAK
jgi:cell division septal protein FtsQ